MGLFTTRKILWMLIIISLCVSLGSSLWRRRRRRRCDTTPCKWKWGSCSKRCGGGIQKPIVTKKQGACGKCTLPKPRRCNTKCCKVNCRWGYWGKWSRCSKTCGGGKRVRSRRVLIRPKCGGYGCVGRYTQSVTCNAKCCPVNCIWGSWQAIAPCTKTCGGGKQFRIRDIKREAKCGGRKCSHSKGSFVSNISCNNKCCPVNCLWNKWGSWGRCSSTCGKGVSTRRRSVRRKQSCGGKSCPGSSYASRTCNKHPCLNPCTDLGCSLHSRCISTNDGYDCVCKSGYFGDGFFCSKS